MPVLTVSLRWMTPSTRGPSATTSGVPPPLAIRSTTGARSRGIAPPASSTQRRTESAAPLLIRLGPRSMPLIRVWAENGTSPASAISGGTSG